MWLVESIVCVLGVGCFVGLCYRSQRTTWHVHVLKDLRVLSLDCFIAPKDDVACARAEGSARGLRDCEGREIRCQVQ
jgi:hypothetical protein